MQILNIYSRILLYSNKNKQRCDSNRFTIFCKGQLQRTSYESGKSRFHQVSVLCAYKHRLIILRLSYRHRAQGHNPLATERDKDHPPNPYIRLSLQSASLYLVY